MTVLSFTRIHCQTRRRAWLIASVLGMLTLGLPRAAARDSIVNSKHNLSSFGSGTIRAQDESEICIFCHTPHSGSSEAPLWNRFSSGASYTAYSSTTLNAAVGQPTGASKLCLSCHDGTVALGMVLSRPQITMQNSVTTMPLGKTRLSTDLADDHPISFVFDAGVAAADGQLKDPAVLTDAVRLEDGRVQCISCHNPHDNQFGKFLVKNNTASALCLTCHNRNYWDNCSHKLSGKTWNGVGSNPWPHTSETTVANNACENCHSPHNAGSKPRLLNYGGEEQNCFPCHNGNVAAKNIQNEFNKIYVHPIANTTGVHDLAEDAVNPPRHVECFDCHNPHGVNSSTSSPPTAPGTQTGVRGININGSVVNPINNLYELCFRCHADSTARGPARVTRQFPQTNTRLEYSPSNTSFHPVVTTGRNPTMPSLIAPLTPASMIFCTSCHNNNQGPGAGGTGPKGPHGSTYLPLLERRQDFTDGGTAYTTIYALCLKCHDWDNIRSNASFPEHDKHVRGSDKVACTSCHDPHGSPNPHLINFNTSYAQPNSQGKFYYVSTGLRRGYCSVLCHGQDHVDRTYAP